MEALELRNKTDVLESNIKDLVVKFIMDVGVCNINIYTDFEYVNTETGKRILVDTKVKVKVSV